MKLKYLSSGIIIAASALILIPEISMANVAEISYIPIAIEDA
ncbi:hypothetical protein [Xenorhabdus doucetiae]|nr:hypothetical protein [Xenorhabdus doucetiae]